MIHVLILVISTMQGEAVTTQEFHSKSRCLEAREVVMKHTHNARAYCLLK